LPSLNTERSTLNILNVDFCGRTIWIADAHRDDKKRFVVRADEKLTAFLELESQLVVKGIAPVAGCTTKAP
jgi:hypothetical protein